ncbi:hypothetical protein [Euzebya pacifica]|uniref:hypothetical protein n=1 Tax=Euzebya pacifica TaxID=1608957 RepID=UPI0030F654D7
MTPSDAQLTAWLAGDLDPIADAEVSAAVESDPAVAARADALAGVLAGLAMAAADPPPADFAESLDAGLAAALGLAAPAPPVPPAPRAPTPPPAVSRRPAGRRDIGHPGGSRTGRRLQRLTSGLAVLLLVVASGGLLVRTLRDGTDSVLPPDPDVATLDTEPSGPGEEGSVDPASADPEPSSAAAEEEDAPDDGTLPTEAGPSQDEGVAEDVPAGPAATPGPAGGSTNGAPEPADTGDGAGAPSPPVAATGPTAADDGDRDGDPTPAPPTPAPAPVPPPSAEPQPTEDAAGSGGGPTEEGDTTAQPDGPSAAPPAAGDEGDAPADGQPQPEAAPAAPPSRPTVADSRADLPTDDDVRAWFGGREETHQLLGLPEEEARDRAAEHRAVVEKSASFTSGAHPATCLDEALAGDSPAVVAAVESVVHDGQDALAYLVVRGTPELARADVLVATPNGCTTLFRGPVTA